ncbi:MAG: A/G-specific adenine glycosylase [Gammaproteobacteria bacterium]|nr:A/G-specific adenine glycosylase [Gammaproteobacteria bacterium]NDE35109.1 A/G-specific adenine glycosylase [Gammaproteobacteria bacterium]NDE57090.1 A/G-specific adenine glycosylase [Gammaproteobacteria bacterium]NDG88359.1 A/G-specific adenine glycosylase [Gammaproteobacteria bacterium]
MTLARFAKDILHWFDDHGRKHLPWQIRREPYTVWISEIMLQQTQVQTVIPYYERFMARFPTIEHLAKAPRDDVMAYWAGLGYYARARHLKTTAEKILMHYEGHFPSDRATIESLPGIGRSTAGAILSLGFRQRAAILDGNVKRVLARHAGIEGWPGHSGVLKTLWEVSEARTPIARFDDYNQAMMDLGALICTHRRPACDRCPVMGDCSAHQSGRQNTLPAPKPKRQQPIRNVWMLILVHPHRGLFLVQRPDAGIWGGLMSLAEFESIKALEDWYEQHNQGKIEDQWIAPIRRHTFSHYHLDFTPVIAPWSGDEEAPGLQGCWVLPHELQALPAPIEKLLKDPKTFKPLSKEDLIS